MLTKPDLDEEKIADCLRRAYGLEVNYYRSERIIKGYSRLL